ncbi:MAG: cell wall-binding repeat-containing protein [Finegoldia magna]|uniref:cell wall-binding repeat-containing protein n=1 Tax=Finegoldia magna TaxID=1260 RepID=UPI00290E2AF5|nr:cell wall-binding repeat-containing protein [Finegoldia magna]MDU7032239.1 cell wall-binding repeat-containing protein [Finegoldia magna]
MRHSIRKEIRRFLCFLMTFIMILTSMPVHLLAANDYHNNLSNNKSKIINDNKTPVKVAKPEAGKTAADLILNPEQPAIYTLRTDYKVQRGEKYDVNYQPYVASVGADASDAEKAKVKQTIKLPALSGYIEPQDDFTIDYDTIVNKAKAGTESKDANNGDRYSAGQAFNYKAKSNSIKIKHVFQDLEDFTKYTNPDGSVGEKGERITTQDGNTGSTMEVSPLGESDPDRKGFVPEAPYITMQVPENAENFILEYRYNRAHYDVVFDTKGGTALPTRTLYYGQLMPKIADESIPTKVGGEFLGWKPSVELKTKDGKTFKANEIIKVGTDAIKNLDANLIMPASKVTFTAAWKDKDKADYAVQFWAEKADHADGASLADKYEYIGTHVYKDQDTGSRPDLDNVSVDKIVFPDLDQKRLAKIWAGAKFNRGKDLYLNKFYVYNQAVTQDQNKDPENVNLVKSVDATGNTVYNIYYDRQVYDLYFTKSNALPAENTFYPEIWGYDEAKGEVVMKGGPGDPYHYKARFNQLMLGWPNDAMQTKGFDKDKQSFGWGPNYAQPNWPTHLDTPPYRLNADEFLDMKNYDLWGGYTKKIDKGDGTSIDLKFFDYKILSFGIKQAEKSMPHHMDFWMDGFKPDETIIRYDLYRSKADTNSDTYAPSYPKVQGFTGKRGNETPEYLDEGGIDEKNEERESVTPFPDKTYTDMYGTRPVGEMKFIKAFFNNGDEWGDPDGWDGFDTNGYLKFEYTRNKYPLRFNYDPSKIKGDNEFDSTNSLDTFYEFPLKALSPDVDTEESYKTENPKNILDNPEKLQELGLKDLVFKDSNDNNKLKVKRPENLSDQMVFKGWALDPAGSKLIWENPGEKMPSHPVNLYAKWGEPDYKWKVTFDPNDGSLRNIKEEDLTTSRKKIQEGDIGQEEINTYAKKEANDGNKQIFTVIQRQKLVEPKIKPTRKGYDFMGWEVIRYKKDATTGDYTNEQDTSYRDTYKVPELYSFGNDVVAPVYLKAIWVPNARVDVKVEHYMLDKDYSLKKKLEDTLEDKRANYLVATTGDKQDQEYILATHKELEENLKDYKDQDGKEYKLKTEYDAYNERVKADNTFFQQFRVEPEKILNTETNKLEDNPKVENNVFKFFYKPFRTREYKVNYIDERFKGKETQEGAAIINQELVENGNRHYDARNYRQIPGWKLVSAPQQQLFFDVNEETNEFLGINGTGKDEITFYYKDVRVIEVPGDKKPPEGYVRVTYKADKGGSFTDKDGKSVKELHYDVIKGLKSDLLPVPQELAEGKTKEEGKYYITPETGKKFTKWDEKPLLNKNTIVDNDTKDFYVFTAKFEWSGLSATGLVRTEAFKDPKGTWTNDFAPTIDQLKKQLVWKEKDQVKPLPDGAVIKLYDEKDNELTSDDQVYDLVNEKKAADKDELVRTVNVKAKVTFKDGKEPQELDIPITVYKNVYEALNKEGDKPLFLKEAEGKKAEEGGLKDVTGDYVMVTIKADKDFNAKDDKIYWVNKNAWVEIPEVKTEGSSTFVNWTADKDAQNENGIFDFGKRHKFTEDTVISPSDAKDVVEQKDPKKKPDVPNSYVKVIVKTTDKATDETKFEKTFWVNPTKEVTIDVKNPTGKTVAADATKPGTVGYTMNFFNWKSEEKTSPRTWKDKIVGKFEKETTIVAKYSVEFEKIKDNEPTTDTVDVPKGKVPTADEIKAKLTPPEGKTIKEVKIVENPDVNNPGKSIAKVIVEYTDGSSVGTKDKPVEVPVEVHEPIVKSNPDGTKPKDAMDNYVKVIFKAKEGGTVSGDLVYYVSPEVEVNMTESAGKITKKPDVGYISGDWDTSETKKLKDTFKANTEFTFNFKKTDDIVEKTDENTKKPEGYVTVTLIPTDKATDATKKVYFVNPKAENVTITNKPEGKKENVNNIDQTYTFKGWKVTKGTIASWDNENINGQFTQDTEITAQYSTNVVPEKLVPAPVAKKDVVTPKGDKPKPEDLITNIPGSEKDPLPKGTKITYEEEPKVDNPGDSKAKVKIEYPGGKTVVVEVPIKVVDNVVPQTGKDKPLVPESYVKVIVDTTDKATANTKFEKTFWVKPNVEVTIPDILAPTGKQEKIGEVTKTNKFVKWKLEGSKPEKFYETKITDTFKDKESKIVATYEQDKNVEPKGKDDQWIPQGANPSPRDFIKNPYNDDDPNNKDNLPPGTKFGFVPGKEPDTKTPGTDKETTIKITYPNGETKEVPVKYNVTGDVVEQKEGEDKPKVPDNFVKVIVKTTDKATDETKFEKTFWVNPTKEVTIDVTNPTGKTVAADPIKVGAVGYTMKFSKWETEDKAKTWEDKILGQFTAETTIVAKYSVKPEVVKPQVPSADTVHTPQGKTPTADEIKAKITPPEGKTIKEVKIVENPDVTKPGESKVKVIVEYTDGSSVGTNDNPVVIPVEVHKNIIPEAPGGQKPKDALGNYVKVIFKAGTGGSLSGDLVYYVSPEVEVDMTESAKAVTKTPDTGYFVNGEKWTNKANKTLKGTFTDPETEFVFNFDKSKDIVEKTEDPKQVIPKGYVKVTFKTENEAKGKLEGDKLVKIYYVNPKADIKLVELADGKTAGEKQLAVPKTAPAKNYVFDKWYEEIDTETAITSERIHVAKFIAGEVTLTYDAGEGKGTVPAEVKVSYGTSVRLARPDGLSKENAKFAGWKLDGEDKIYQPGDQVKLEKARTATAQWTNDKNIIPYDPNEPITRPEGYVRVTFAVKDGLKLTESKAYYVKKNAGIKLGDAELVKPKYKEETGYKFDKWDKENTLEIKDEDVVVTAQPTPIDDAIEVKTGVEKPAGYVEVKFVAGENGTVVEKTYYVNPTKYVKLTPPTAKGNTGFEFGGWSQNAEIFTQYTEKITTIIANFNPVDSVIPKTENTKKPEGYVTVTFVIKGEGGQIVEGETITYFVNPAKDVTVPQPKTQADTGYVFDKWDQDTVTTAKKYTEDTTVTGKFRKLDDIIPSTDKNGKPNAKPEGYVTVTFDKGANGNLTGQTSYYVNPNAGKKLSDIIKPEVKPETGFKFTKWDKEDAQPVKNNITVTAQYEAIADVVPKTKKDDSEKPAGYIKVTFDTTEKGKIKGTTNTTKVVFVNPNKAVVLKGFDPEVVANKGHEFERWDTSIEKAIQYKNGDTIKAIYKDDTTPGGTTPGGTTPGDKPGDKPGDNPGGTTPGDKPGDEPGDNPGGTTPGDQPGDKPGDNPGGTTPGGTTPGTNPETPGDKPGENPDKPGTVPENPGAIPGTKPGVVEKHGNRYVERVAGKNRVHTAISTSKRFFKKSKYVIIADSGNYPDALTATVLAHVLDCPILLNNTRYLEDDVAREIVRLGASEVIIVGGHKSISENVKSQLAKYDANKVQRIWGRDRYVTSSELAYEIERLTGKVDKAIIASGENFPDALATAPLGSKEIAPILLVTRNQMDKKVSKALKDLNIKRVYVAGGQNSVSKKLEAQLPQVIRRFSGQDRYETAILVASYTYPESKEVFVASGETFPDALVIGPVCARRKAPILLSKSTPVKVTDDYIEKSKIEYLYIIGGTNTIHVDTAHKYAIED